MTWSVGVLRTESWTECIDVSECHCAELTLELSAHCEACLLAEEILCVVDTALLVAWEILHIESGHAEHLSGSLAVRGSDKRCMHIYKALFVEELVDGICHLAPHPINGSESVCPRTKVSNSSEELE